MHENILYGRSETPNMFGNCVKSKFRTISEKSEIIRFRYHLRHFSKMFQEFWSESIGIRQKLGDRRLKKPPAHRNYKKRRSHTEKHVYGVHIDLFSTKLVETIDEKFLEKKYNNNKNSRFF